MSTITSANSVFTLDFRGSNPRYTIFSVPQTLQGFAADDVFTSDILATSEILMGVDGALSAGFVFNPIVQHISLQADSQSNTVFDVWYEWQLLLREVIFVNGLVQLVTLETFRPSANMTYAQSPADGKPMRAQFVMFNGVLTNYPVIADVARTLRPRRYTITWERVGAKPADSTMPQQYQLPTGAQIV